MTVDKSFADSMIHAFRHDAGYRYYYRGCPCCGSEDDCRRPVESRVLRFLHSSPLSHVTQEWFERYRCDGCGSHFTALFRDQFLVGFRETASDGDHS